MIHWYEFSQARRSSSEVYPSEVTTKPYNKASQVRCPAQAFLSITNVLPVYATLSSQAKCLARGVEMQLSRVFAEVAVRQVNHYILS